jgi:hypothetical protein
LRQLLVFCLCYPYNGYSACDPYFVLLFALGIQTIWTHKSIITTMHGIIQMLINTLFIMRGPLSDHPSGMSVLNYKNSAHLGTYAGRLCDSSDDKCTTVITCDCVILWRNTSVHNEF